MGVSPAAATAYETRAPLPLPGRLKIRGVSPAVADLQAEPLPPGRMRPWRSQAEPGAAAGREGGRRALPDLQAEPVTSRWPPGRARNARPKRECQIYFSSPLGQQGKCCPFCRRGGANRLPRVAGKARRNGPKRPRRRQPPQQTRFQLHRWPLFCRGGLRPLRQSSTPPATPVLGNIWLLKPPTCRWPARRRRFCGSAAARRTRKLANRWPQIRLSRLRRRPAAQR